MSGSARSHRRTEQPKPKRKSRKGYHFLLSCCIFFAILCACLITALVFIGKHYYYNGNDSNSPRYQPPKHLLTRLPDQVLPNSYDITLKPNLDSGDFKGTVNISLTVTNDTSEIILHSNRLTIGHVNLFNSTGLVVDIHDVKANPIDEIITITTKTTLLPDDYNLIIGFSGTLLNRTVGLYRSQYVDKETKTKRAIATSKFEPTYARQAFPCFDEPNKKARFKVSLLKPKDPSYIALFNMPEEGETEMEDGVMVTFQESVKMSTYLACFIVSDFKSTKDSIASKSGNIPFRVFATPAQLNKTDYARVTGKKVMEFYLDYFNIPYPLPKLDMVAIPDFVSGAMEHWGLVTFRETALLYDPDISSTTNKQRVAAVIAHELAHSWFGNLVTMDWWNDLWLNEGFASYIEYKGIHAAEPTWQMLDRFTTTDMHSVLKLDAALGSHPIVRNVETPDQITASFDAISYNKGASVLRMLENAVGEDVFQQGITNYLIKHKFDNAVTQDLLDQLQSLVSKDLNVTDFVNTWTVQMGYPILDVTKIEGGYRLTQKRFLTNDEAKSDTSEPYNYRWTVPVTYITSDSSTPVLKWFKHIDNHLDIKSSAEWIKFNSKQVGYYRVNYPLNQWQLLSDNIKNFSIPDRAHLIEESFRIAESNQLPYDVPLNLSKYLKEEFEYVPWIVASRMLSQIQVYLSTSSRFTEFKNFVIGLVTPAYNHFSWNESVDDSHLRRLGRITVLRLACKVDHPECLTEANKKFQKWLNGEEVLSQDLKELVYEFGMKTATKDQWEIVWSRYIDEIDAGEKVRLMGGLTSINDISVLTRLIDLAKDDTYIRSQDYFSCLSSISNNPVGTSLVWDYVRENWEQLVNRFGLNERNLGRLIPDITSTFSTKTKMDEMNAFFNAYPNAGAGRGARVQALETVKNNIKWVAKNKEPVESWIEKNGNQ